ncbi:hypothetical protein CCOS865_00676 [Pseudomonas reidholzensis]|uniref:Uncharacterized protein n=1 Tax=Pseudomonas reidholzensis TaxID=1785162 RepID=A0A383RN01_9PSED|nr:hypothetical protein CCOS865_00676 [Pseudomonas reidholzensis]
MSEITRTTNYRHARDSIKQEIQSSGNAVRLKPEDICLLNFHLSAVDDQLLDAYHQPTVGLILCGDRPDVNYALFNIINPWASAHVSPRTFL